MATLNAKRIFNGDEYMSLISGEHHTVEKVVGENIIFTDGKDVDIHKLEKLFKFVKRNGEVEALASDFQIEDSSLVYKGEKIKSSINFVKVLSEYKDKVLVEIEKTGGKHTVVSYSIKDDYFKEFVSVLPADKVELIMEKPLPVFLFTDELEDGSTCTTLVEYQGERDYALMASGVWVFQKSGMKKFNYSNDNEGIQLFFTSNIKNVEDEREDEDAPVHYHQELVEQTRIVQFALRAVRDDEGNIIEYSTDGVSDNEVKMPIEEIIPHWSDTYVARTGEGIICFDPALMPRFFKGKEGLEAYDKYPNFVKLDAGRRHNVLWLADDNYNLLKIHCELTSDRGYVTEVVPVEWDD